MSNNSSDPPMDDACNDINYCRQQSDIVYGCLGTIFACVWVAVHRNIPRVSEPNISRKAAIVEWFEGQIESIVITVAALAVPEFVVGLAAFQWITAKRIARELEQLAAKTERENLDRAVSEATDTKGFPEEHSGHYSRRCM